MEHPLMKIVTHLQYVVCNPPNLRYTLSATQESEVRQTIENIHADDFGVSEYLAVLQLLCTFEH